MEYNFKPGQKLMVELEDCIYEGSYESSTSTRIDMTDVREYPAATIIPSNFTFYRCEILDVKILDDGNCSINSDSDSNTNQSNHVKIKQEEYKRLEKALTQHIYICNADKRYYDMIESIKDAVTCAIMCFSNHPGRLSKLSLMVLSVCNKLYIIDIKQFKQRNIPKELKDMLESEWIKKITYSGKWFADSLYHCHNIKKLTNVFDIKEADACIQKKTSSVVKSRSLAECLLYHLNLPKSILNVDTNDVYKVNWDERPLTKEMENIALQHCLYLRTLKDWMEKLIMSDVYTNTMTDYRNLIDNKTTIQFQESSETFKDDIDEF